ncbi:MAG: Hint domain-containing protein [Pseudodonghicola sp.]
MATTFNVISLGVYADIDPTEGNAVAENASSLVGLTIGSASDPLFNHFASFSPGTTGSAAGTSSVYDMNNNAANDTFSVDGGADQIFDGVANYNATITYKDGTTASITAIVFQDVNGNTYWAPEATLNADQTAMDAKLIVSLSLDSLAGDTFSGLGNNRDPWVPATVCFTSGTRIKARHGDVAVEVLRAGCDVLTLDDGYQKLRWIGSRTFGAADLAAHPNLRPIRIRAGALGLDQPDADLVVSPQHRVLVRSVVAERMFGEAEVLVAAKQLLALDGIEVSEDLAEVTYWHFLFDAHQVVFSNGAMTESLFTGPEALRAVCPEARQEILEIFPDLDATPDAGTDAVRLLVSGRLARKLVERTARNGKLLVA